MKRIFLAALVGVLVWGGIVFIFNPGIVSAQSAFDSCMRKYSPTPGPNYGFMAAQSACHAATRATSKKHQRAALCVASASKKVRSPKQYNLIVERCYGSLAVDPQIALTQCILPNYLKVRSQAELQTLVRLCKR